MDALETKVYELREATDAKLPHIGLPMTGCTVGIDFNAEGDQRDQAKG
jgi:hypothetical protein